MNFLTILLDYRKLSQSFASLNNFGHKIHELNCNYEFMTINFNETFQWVFTSAHAMFSGKT